MQVTLAKPLGVRFSRGNDGGAYVVRTDAKLGNIDSQIEVRLALLAAAVTPIWKSGTQIRLPRMHAATLCTAGMQEMHVHHPQRWKERRVQRAGAMRACRWATRSRR